MQKSLALPGVWFEHCYASTLIDDPTSIEAIAAAIRAIGPSHCVLTTDLGLAGLPGPIDGMRSYLSSLMDLGFSWGELLVMTRDNPAHLLGL